MALNPAHLAWQQWKQLVAILRAESLSGGRLYNQTWTTYNNDGTTLDTGAVTIKDVRQAQELWTRQVPAAGVQLVRVPQAQYGSGRQKATSEFLIIVGCQSTVKVVGTDKIPANLDNAMAQLSALILDPSQTGKGLVNVLLDPANYTLGNTANRIQITDVVLAPEIRPGDDDNPDVWAYGYISLIAEKLVSITQ